tara:strand:- start:8688 stop:9377 length:690 start_codon:yes stop_codon:yes gene_type:complete
VVTNENDTVYGAYYNGKLKKSSKGKFKLKNIKTIQSEGLIYRHVKSVDKSFYSDKNDSLVSLHKQDAYSSKKRKNIYVHKLKTKDYSVVNNDTIYGLIYQGVSNNFEQIINKEKKILNVKSFFFRGFKYEFKEKKKLFFGDSSSSYLKVLYQGKINLYEHYIKGGYNQPDIIGYFIEYKSKLTYLMPKRSSRILVALFPEIPELHDLFRNRTFSYSSLYATIIYINDNL